MSLQLESDALVETINSALEQDIVATIDLESKEGIANAALVLAKVIAKCNPTKEALMSALVVYALMLTMKIQEIAKEAR